MATLPSITFNKGQGGLGRALPGQDYISGMLIYTANGNLPSGFTTSARVKAFYALSDAVSAGIVNTYSDATAAVATYLITAAGATGDTIELKVADINLLGVAQSTSLGVYTKVAGDSTIALLGASLAASINAGTITHGYSATFVTATLTLTAPKRLGIYLNTGTPLSATIVGTIAGTIAQFTAVTPGVASRTAVWYYHISEFFRLQPQGVLYVGFYPVPGTYTFTDITTMQQFANGTIRQIGVFKDPAAAYTTADITAINTVCVANDAAKKPLSAIYAADLSGTTDISTLTDLSLLTANKVSDCIAQDGAAQGNYLWLTVGKSITTLGAELGTVAKASVSQDIAWIAQFNISNGTECEVLAFANGQKFTDVAITDNLIESLNAKRHIFLIKKVGISGSFWNDSHTAIALTSDYAYIEDNRTIDKATRILYSALLPSLNGPLLLNSDGTLRDTTIAYLETQGNVGLDEMVRNEELSAKSVVINPAQNVLITSQIIIAVTLVKNGVARYILVPIGFKLSI